jgi:hypothetical protein
MLIILVLDVICIITTSKQELRFKHLGYPLSSYRVDFCTVWPAGQATGIAHLETIHAKTAYSYKSSSVALFPRHLISLLRNAVV